MDQAMRVVVIDHDRASCELVAGCLAHLGHHVERTVEGRDAAELYRAAAPDLLVCDASLPFLDELTDYHPATVVLLSERWESEQVRLAERLAAVRVGKPVRPLELVAAVNACRRPTRVLVADADADTAESLGWLLELYGCRVRVTCEQAAAEAAEQFRPDLILVDADDRSGFDVVRRIRARGCWAARIAAHTGWTGEHFTALARAAGCDDYLVKPVAPEVLRGLVEAVSAGR